MIEAHKKMEQQKWKTIAELSIILEGSCKDEESRKKRDKNNKKTFNKIIM